MAKGMSNTRIAREMVVELCTVEKHIQDIFTILELNGKPDVDARVSASLLFLKQEPAPA